MWDCKQGLLSKRILYFVHTAGFFCDGWDRLKENHGLIVPPSSLVVMELLWQQECLGKKKYINNKWFSDHRGLESRKTIKLWWGIVRKQETEAFKAEICLFKGVGAGVFSKPGSAGRVHSMIILPPSLSWNFPPPWIKEAAQSTQSYFWSQSFSQISIFPQHPAESDVFIGLQELLVKGFHKICMNSLYTHSKKENR